MRKRVYRFIVFSVLMLSTLPVDGQDRNASLDPELTNYQYPFPVGFHAVDTQRQKLRMAYMDVAAAPRNGHTPNGRTAVLLHGKNFSGAYWSPTIKALVAEGYRVIAPDQIGFGKSSKPAAYHRHPEYRRVAWNAALTSDMIFTQPVLYEFDRLKSPTLLIIGQRDRTAIGKDRVPKEVAARMGDYATLGKAAARRIPGARLVEIPEAGHVPQVESFPKYIRALLDFMAGG